MWNEKHLRRFERRARCGREDPAAAYRWWLLIIAVALVALLFVAPESTSYGSLPARKSIDRYSATGIP